MGFLSQFASKRLTMNQFYLTFLGLLVVFASSSFAIVCYTEPNGGAPRECNEKVGNDSCFVQWQTVLGPSHAIYDCNKYEQPDGCYHNVSWNGIKYTSCVCHEDRCNTMHRCTDLCNGTSSTVATVSTVSTVSTISTSGNSSTVSNVSTVSTISTSGTSTHHHPPAHSLAAIPRINSSYGLAIVLKAFAFLYKHL